MFSELFGKKKERKGNSPWDEIRHGGVTIPIWRAQARDGQSRFVFGISRVYEKHGESYYAKTYEIRNLMDIFHGLEKLAMKLTEREDVSLKNRQFLARILVVLEQVLSSPEVKGGQYVNGRSEPRR